MSLLMGSEEEVTVAYKSCVVHSQIIFWNSDNWQAVLDSIPLVEIGILTLCTPGDGLPTLRKLPNAARSPLTDGTVYERSGW